MSDEEFGPVDESGLLLAADQVEAAMPLRTPLRRRRGYTGLREGRNSQAVLPDEIPEWAMLAEPWEPDTSDYESSSGVGNDKKSKADRDRRMRKAGRCSTPEWITVPKEKRYLFSKFTDFGQGPMTLVDWLVSSRPSPRTPSPSPSRSASVLCGNPQCSGQHSLRECPNRGRISDFVLSKSSGSKSSPVICESRAASVEVHRCPTHRNGRFPVNPVLTHSWEESRFRSTGGAF